MPSSTNRTPFDWFKQKRSSLQQLILYLLEKEWIRYMHSMQSANRECTHYWQTPQTPNNSGIWQNGIQQYPTCIFSKYTITDVSNCTNILRKSFIYMSLVSDLLMSMSIRLQFCEWYNMDMTWNANGFLWESGANFTERLSRAYCLANIFAKQYKTDYQPKCMHFVWKFGW